MNLGVHWIPLGPSRSPASSAYDCNSPTRIYATGSGRSFSSGVPMQNTRPDSGSRSDIDDDLFHPTLSQSALYDHDNRPICL